MSRNFEIKSYVSKGNIYGEVLTYSQHGQLRVIKISTIFIVFYFNLNVYMIIIYIV